LSVARWYSSAPPRSATRTFFFSGGDETNAFGASFFSFFSHFSTTPDERASALSPSSSRKRDTNASADVTWTTPFVFAILRSATFLRRLQASRATPDCAGVPAATFWIETYERGSMS
jgi:hypothetical protein